MFPVIFDQRHEVVDISRFQRAIVLKADPVVAELLAELSPEKPWWDRKVAAHQLGSMRSEAALAGLLAALPTDPFWMVRCAIIQALESMGDPGAIDVLKDVAECDSFAIVKGYAEAAIERLSQVV